LYPSSSFDVGYHQSTNVTVDRLTMSDYGPQ